MARCARGAGGALQQTWADYAALTIWQEKGDGIGNGVRLIVAGQRHQSLSMVHTGRPPANICASVCPKPGAAGDGVQQGLAWAPREGSGLQGLMGWRGVLVCHLPARWPRASPLLGLSDLFRRM